MGQGQIRLDADVEREAVGIEFRITCSCPPSRIQVAVA